MLSLFCVLSGNPPYPYQPSQYPPQPRYVRNPPPTNDPALPPYPGTYPQERQCPPQPSSSHFSNANPHGYAPPPHYDGRRHPAYPPPPPQSYPHREDPSSMPVDEASRERYLPEGYHPSGPHPSHMRPYTPRVRTGLQYEARLKDSIHYYATYAITF